MDTLEIFLKSTMGIDMENDYEPKYITIRGKGDKLAELRRYAKKKADKYIWQLTRTVKAKPSAGIWPTSWASTPTSPTACLR